MNYQILSEKDRNSLKTHLVIALYKNKTNLTQKILDDPKIFLKLEKNKFTKIDLKILIYNYKNTETPLISSPNINILPNRINKKPGILSLLSREVNEVLNETYETTKPISFKMENSNQTPIKYTTTIKIKTNDNNKNHVEDKNN